MDALTPREQVLAAAYRAADVAYHVFLVGGWKWWGSPDSPRAAVPSHEEVVTLLMALYDAATRERKSGMESGRLRVDISEHDVTFYVEVGSTAAPAQPRDADGA